MCGLQEPAGAVFINPARYALSKMGESTIENVAFKSFEEWYDYDDANELVDDLLEMFYEEKEKINRKIDSIWEKALML